jgi:iron complex transport system substrate-binding protein
VETGGLTNVFGEVDQRVFDIGFEELRGRDPDRLIILRDPEADPQALEDALLAMPGAQRLRAARTDAISTLIFNYTDPPTPLSVEGLERITEEFAAN